MTSHAMTLTEKILADHAIGHRRSYVRPGDVLEAAEGIYSELLESGVDVLLDDRDERPGVKFNDADLVGFPVRVVVGARSLAEGNVELSHRRDGEKELVSVGEAAKRADQLLSESAI